MTKIDPPWRVYEHVELSREPVKAEKRIEVVLGRITDYEIIVGQLYEIARLRREAEEASGDPDHA